MAILDVAIAWAITDHDVLVYTLFNHWQLVKVMGRIDVNGV
jgi:hypothetical protein